MPAHGHPASKSASVKGVQEAINTCEDGHRRRTFSKAVYGNINGVAVGGFDLTNIDGGGNGPKSRSLVDV